MSLFKLGLIVNPVAGIGGRVGLKGSDGSTIRQRAFELGATAEAGLRATQTLKVLNQHKELFQLYTVKGAMGEECAVAAGLDYQLVVNTIKPQTEACDTRDAVRALNKQAVDLILFAGGDGTARDVFNELEALQALESTVVIGIPAGCKIHSAVYGVSPVHTGELVSQVIQGQALSFEEADVMDIDEVAFRDGVVKAKRYGGLWVPKNRDHMQSLKEGGVEHESVTLQNMALTVIEQMQNDAQYLIGSGTTPAAIMEELGLENTLLGVDLVINQSLVASDLTENEILDVLQCHKDKEAYIVITVIGGQGIVFGRGNQQLSPEVIKKVGLESIIYLATTEKIRHLAGRSLRVDSGDETLNSAIAGMVKIITGYDEYLLYRIDN